MIVQVTGNASLSGSKNLSVSDKAVLLGRTVTFEVNGQTVVGSLVESQSGGLTARFAVKIEVSGLGEPREKVKGPSGLDSLMAAVAAARAPEGSEEEETEETHEGLDL